MKMLVKTEIESWSSGNTWFCFVFQLALIWDQALGKFVLQTGQMKSRYHGVPVLEVSYLNVATILDIDKVDD